MKRYIDSTHGHGTSDSLRGFVRACMLGCVGFAGGQSKLALGPVVRGTVEVVTWMSREPCASAHGEQMCCGTEATWDVLCAVRVWGNPCVSEMMSQYIAGTRAWLAWTVRRLEERVWGL